MTTRIDLIRHGEPVGGRRYRGDAVDDPLTAEGWAQMERALAGQGPWDAVITSPLARCRAFAELVSGKAGLPLSVEPALREIGFGVWEGLTHEQVRLERPDEYAPYARDPVHCRPPGAEPLADFAARVAGAYEALVAAHRGQHVLVISHAVVLRALVAHALQAPLIALHRIRIQYADLVVLEHDGAHSHLLRLGGTGFGG
ncbi:MAG: histidine phosphatase family protein [Halothiobacillaceae bacterium]|jgi:probable phosphoglycerate mutase|nr:histidine phosphatase family protein [Halothiobacillaceae bacterium]MDY0049538.1 histidine phosphatase family protein [Halothiobacillaceae bacterium]